MSASAGTATGLAASTPPGQKLFVQFSLFEEKGVHKTTNYRKGNLVPVNSEVTFVKVNKRDITVRRPDGTELLIANVEEYSGEKVDGIFKRTFATNKVDLTQFTEPERKAIRSGSVEVGMTKSAVLLAIGYPPKHKTPSLEGNRWQYWHNKFGTFLVIFDEDKVAAIKE